MAIVGLPVAGGAIPDEEYDDDSGPDEDDGEDGGEDDGEDCTVADPPIVRPSTVGTHGNQLTADLEVTFTSNGSPACADLRIELVGTRTTPSVTTLSFDCACGTGPSHTWTYHGSDNIWMGHANGTVRVLSGSTVLTTRPFPVS